MSDGIILRLSPDDSLSWALYPRFEERNVIVCRDIMGYTDQQITGYRQDLRKRWAGEGGGLFLAMMQEDSMVGHLAGWIIFEWNVPYFWIYQMQVDQGVVIGREGMERAFEHIADYIGWCNSIYETAKAGYRIAKVRMQTQFDPQIIIRFIGGRGGVKERTVLQWDV